MNNRPTFSIPKNAVSKAGNALGIKANRLAGFFGLSESGERKMPEEDGGTILPEEGWGTILPEESWKTILPVILNPRNFSGIIALFQDDSMLFTNILTGEEDAVFCGEEEGNLKVMPMTQTEIIELLASYLGETGTPSKIKQELSADALIAMLSIADSIRRARLGNMLDPSKNDFEITGESLGREYENTVKSGDLRWLAPLMAELRWESKPVDFTKALGELNRLGIIRFQNGKVDIDERGEIFFQELASRKTMIGIRSVFYHEGALNYLSMAFMRTEHYLWYLDVADNGCMMSLEYEALKGMIGTMISPGEAPPEGTAAAGTDREAGNNREARISGETGNSGEAGISEAAGEAGEKKEERATPKFCKYCGGKLNEGAKFCKRCGNKIG